MDGDGREWLFEVPPSEEEPEKPTACGRPLIAAAERSQIEWRVVSLDGSLPVDHEARAIYGFVEKLDLTSFYERVRSRERIGGRPSIDPKILMALWILAFSHGVVSAREIESLCREHVAYAWVCGGVSVNYHTIADFRSKNAAEFARVLVGSAAVLMKQGLLTLDRVSQDGMRVRASAGAASFRRRKTLGECLREAEARLAALDATKEDPSVAARAKAARKRAAEERLARVSEALRQLPEVEAVKARRARKKEKRPKKHGGAADAGAAETGDDAPVPESAEDESKKTEARVSTTDPDARVMKMADGGFRPAYNVQFATANGPTPVIVEVTLDNAGSDQGKLAPMAARIEADYGRKPGEMLVDGGYTKADDIETVTHNGTTVYAPVHKPKKARDPHVPRPGDSEAIAAWRARMGTAEAKAIYKERAATAECSNAQARNHGLTQFLVRGAARALSAATLMAIGINCLRVYLSG